MTSMMNKQAILVPKENIKQVQNALRQTGVKHYPFRVNSDGYYIEFHPQNHPLVSYLLLKYDINIREGRTTNDV